VNNHDQKYGFYSLYDAIPIQELSCLFDINPDIYHNSNNRNRVSRYIIP